MFLHVTNARHVAGHRVHVSFNDSTSAEIDLSDSLDGPIFEPLRDVEYFKLFTIVGHTIAWPNGADFAPEYLQSLAEAYRNYFHSYEDAPLLVVNCSEIDFLDNGDELVDLLREIRSVRKGVQHYIPLGSR